MNFVDQAGQHRLHRAKSSDGVFGPQARVTLPDHDPALVNIGEMVRVLRRGKWTIVVCLLLCLTIAGTYLWATAPEYVASSQVILEPHRVSTLQETTASFAPALDSAQAESQMQVVKSERILSIVFDTLNLAESPEFAHLRPGLRQRLVTEMVKAVPRLGPILVGTIPPTADDQRLKAFEAFTDRVSVRRIGQSYVLEISYRAASPGQAARLANSITASYIRDQIELKAAAARRGAEFLEDRIAVLRQEQDAAAKAVLDGVIPSTPFPDSDARVISAARVPLGKSYPQTLLILVFAAASGLLAGSAILAVRQSLDRKVRSAGQIWRLFGVDCLTVIPLTRRRGRTKLAYDIIIADAKAPFSQALRSAYTSVVTAGAREVPYRSVGLVSWLPGEGKSTLAGNLAHFIAATGEKVVLIDGDLQDPALTQALAPEAVSGLCEALAEPADLGSLKGVSLRRDLSFVPARGRFEPYVPNLFLGAPQIGRFLNHLRENSDVVVDLPAMIRSPHAQAISGFLDCVILVVECGRTTVDEVAIAIRTLEGAQATLVGVILNKSTSRLGS